MNSFLSNLFYSCIGGFVGVLTVACIHICYEAHDQKTWTEPLWPREKPVDILLMEKGEAAKDMGFFIPYDSIGAFTSNHMALTEYANNLRNLTYEMSLYYNAKMETRIEK